MHATRYRAPPAEALRIVDLDGLVAIYHRPSGTTHLVDMPVPEILAALAQRWLDAPRVLAALAQDYDIVDADAAAMTARLAELVEAGLVERG